MKSSINYRFGTNPKAWVFTIARNICIDVLKREKKYVATDDNILSELVLPSGVDLTAEHMFINECIHKLNYDEREILLLYVYGRLKQKEIAKILDLPYQSVRAKYGYAIKKLRTYFKEWY